MIELKSMETMNRYCEQSTISHKIAVDYHDAVKSISTIIQTNIDTQTGNRINNPFINNYSRIIDTDAVKEIYFERLNEGKDWSEKVPLTPSMDMAFVTKSLKVIMTELKLNVTTGGRYKLSKLREIEEKIENSSKIFMPNELSDRQYVIFSDCQKEEIKALIKDKQTSGNIPKSIKAINLTELHSMFFTEQN